MKEYHKINSIFKRDMSEKTWKTKHDHPFIIGEWSEPEFDYLQNNEWEFSEKIDGTNIRVMFDGENVLFGGKTDAAQIPSHLVDRLNKLFYTLEAKERLKGLFNKDGDPTEACLYGEGFGYKIQGKVGIDYLVNTVDFCLFDIKIGNWWLERKNVYDIANKLGLMTPRVVGYGTIGEAIEVVKKGFKSVFGTAQAEGLVLRPKVELSKRNGERIITKIKARDFNSTKQTT